MRKKTKKMVPGHHPLVVWTDEELQLQQASDETLTNQEVCKRAGVAASTFTNMRDGHTPSVVTLDSVLRVLGYKLAIVEVEPMTRARELHRQRNRRYRARRREAAMEEA